MPSLEPVCPLEGTKRALRVVDETRDVAFPELGRRIIIGLVALFLEVNKNTGETPDLDRKGTHLRPEARFPRPSVVQGPIDAHPTWLPAHVPVEQLVGATLCHPVEQGVVGGTNRAAEVCLKGSARTGRDEVGGRLQEV